MSLEQSLAIRIYVCMNRKGDPLGPPLFDEQTHGTQQKYLACARSIIRNYDIKFKRDVKNE